MPPYCTQIPVATVTPIHDQNSRQQSTREADRILPSNNIERNIREQNRSYSNLSVIRNDQQYMIGTKVTLNKVDQSPIQEPRYRKDLYDKHTNINAGLKGIPIDLIGIVELVVHESGDDAGFPPTDRPRTPACTGLAPTTEPSPYRSRERGISRDRM